VETTQTEVSEQALRVDADDLSVSGIVAMTSRTSDGTGEKVVVANSCIPLTATLALQTALEPLILQVPPKWTAVSAVVAPTPAEK
jgi:hypothetical protein